MQTQETYLFSKPFRQHFGTESEDFIDIIKSLGVANDRQIHQRGFQSKNIFDWHRRLALL